MTEPNPSRPLSDQLRDLAQRVDAEHQRRIDPAAVRRAAEADPAGATGSQFAPETSGAGGEGHPDSPDNRRNGRRPAFRALAVAAGFLVVAGLAVVLTSGPAELSTGPTNDPAAPTTTRLPR